MADDLEKMLTTTLRKFEKGCGWGASLSAHFDGFENTFSNVAENIKRLRRIAKNTKINTKAQESIQKSMKELRAFSQAMADDPITVSNLVEDHIALQMFEEELNKLVKNCTETP